MFSLQKTEKHIAKRKVLQSFGPKPIDMKIPLLYTADLRDTEK